MGGLDTVVAKIPKRNARLQLFGFGVVHAEGLHGDLLHALVGLGLVVHAGLGGGDAVDHVHALGDHTEGGILAVQELPVGVHDEELAAGGVHGLGAGHRQHAALVADGVLHAVGGELTLDAVAGAADADALGVAALDHEAGDDPVEDQAVIEALLDEADEIVHADGSQVRIQLCDDLAAVFHLDGNDRILCHVDTLLMICDSAKEALPPLHFQRPVHLPLCVFLGCGVPLVIELFALAQADLHLHPGAFEIQAQGDEGVAVLLDLGEEPLDLPLVHEQAAGAAGFAVEDVALLIGADVHSVERHLPVLDGAEGILQIHVAHANGLHFRARQFDARLVAVLHKIVVKGFAVFRDLTVAGFLFLLRHGRHLPSSQSDLPSGYSVVYYLPFFPICQGVPLEKIQLSKIKC